MLPPAMLLAPRMRTACLRSAVRGYPRRNGLSVVDCENSRSGNRWRNRLKISMRFHHKKSILSLQRFITIRGGTPSCRLHNRGTDALPFEENVYQQGER